MITMPPVRHFEPRDAGAIWSYSFFCPENPNDSFYPWVSCGLSRSLSQTWLSGYGHLTLFLWRILMTVTHAHPSFQRSKLCVHLRTPCMPFILRYPLVMTNMLLKMAIYSGFTHWKWWFSIVMLIYQGVFKTLLAGRSPICRCTEHGLVFLPGWIATWCAMVLKLNYRTRILLESVKTLISCHSLLSFISFHAVSSHAMHSFIISFFQYFNTSIFHAFVRSFIRSFIHSSVQTCSD